MEKINGVVSVKKTLSGNIVNKSGIQANMNVPKTVYEKDYEKLDNLPSLDGRKIIGDIPELDPTVPDWAKENTKPTYTYKEVGAVGEENQLSFEEIDRMFNAVFGI